MKVFRQGIIEFINLPDQKIEIKSRVNLEPLIILAVGIGFSFCFVGLFISEHNRKFGFIVFGLVVMGLIIVIGIKNIKQRMATILTEAINSIV